MVKNLAEFKRWLATSGATVTMIQHDWYPNGKLMNLPRTVVHQTTTGVQFSGGSWLYFKSAKECRFSDGFVDVDLTGDNSFGQIMRYQLSIEDIVPENGSPVN